MKLVLSNAFKNKHKKGADVRRDLEEALEPLVLLNQRSFPELQECYFMNDHEYKVYDLLRCRRPSIPQPSRISTAHASEKETVAREIVKALRARVREVVSSVHRISLLISLCLISGNRMRSC